MEEFEKLNLTASSSLSSLKAGYFKLSKKFHPNTKTGSHTKFLSIKKVYNQLLRQKKSSEKNTAFDKKIVDFKNNYKNSKEEKEDILIFYEEYKGSMIKIIDNLILANYDEEKRIREIIENEIELNNIERYKKFKNKIPKYKIERMKKEEIEVGEIFKNTKEDNIKFIEQLEKKYLK